MGVRAAVVRRVAVTALVLAGCGASNAVRTGSIDTTPATADSTATSAPGSTLAPTTAATTTTASTTAAPTTAPATAPSTTAAPTTTAAPSGWQPMGVDQLPGQVVTPCCGALWDGPASPELTADPAPLADGRYSATVVNWSASQPSVLTVEVRQIVPCTEIPEICGNDTSPDTFELSPTKRRQITLALDASVKVVDIGYTPNDGSDRPAPIAAGTGAELKSLFSALAASYGELIGGPLRAGTDPDSIIADLRANPRGGFSGADPSDGALVFRDGAAPPVLLQFIGNGQQGDPGALVRFDGTEVVFLHTIYVNGGVPTLYFYDGFMS